MALPATYISARLKPRNRTRPRGPSVSSWSSRTSSAAISACAPMPIFRVMPKSPVKFGAEGIGLCRTEHMFFAEERIPHMQAMILARDEKIAAQGPAQTPAHAAQGFRGSLHRHGRLPRRDPHARSAASRVPSQARRADGRCRDPALRRYREEEGTGREVHPLRRRSQEPQDRDSRTYSTAWKSCTSSTPCSATAAAVSASLIPRSPRCRPAPSSKPPCRWRRRA